MRASSEAQVRSTLLKLEDALRCATLPDAATRVLLVRRLNLGVIAPDVSPQTLSRLLEQRVAAAGGVWTHGAATDASGAAFVCFRDGLEARSELALRLARSEPCAAWYWPLAVPEFEPAQCAPANLHRIAHAIAALPEAAAALPAWIAHLTAAGAAPALAQAITPAEGVELLRIAQRLLNTHSRQPPHTTFTQAPVSTSAQLPRPHSALASLPAWLQTLARAGGFTLHETSAAGHVPRVASAAGHVPRDTFLTGQAPRVLAPHRGPEIVRVRDVPGRRETPAPGGAPAYPDAARAAPPGAGVYASVAATEFGGLLFMLPVLQRLAYPAWADSLPDDASATVVRDLLALILQRLQAPADDPAWLLARACAGGGNDRDPDVAAHAQRWLTACRRWLRRQARIGVASLVRRPAALELSATHAEVYFRLNDIDIRVRRAGLDIDPGWLPWYGKVIAFHYTAPHHGGYTLGG